MSIRNFRTATVVAGAGVLTGLAQLACSTGTDKYCAGRPAAECRSPDPVNAGGANLGVGGSTSTASGTGGVNAGGTVSTSSTVLRIIGNSLRDVSFAIDVENPEPLADASVDSGVDDGIRLVLHGVNRSGTEYQCIKGYSIFDGPDTEESVRAMKTWKINAVRIPLNETCWLAPGDSPITLNPKFTGTTYKTAIQKYVSLLHKYDIYPILELHWAAPNGRAAQNLLPMPDADHAESFWTDVTVTFKDDLGVIFELFNEPFPDDNSDTQAAWECWRDGCTSNIWAQVTDDGKTSWQVITTYSAIGFQQLVDAVRRAEGANAAANHVILLGGVQYSNSLSQWTKYKPSDTANNLGAAWHVYNNNRCAATTCFDLAPQTLSRSEFVLVTEFGENDCLSTKITSWMDWWDKHQLGYLAWSWNAYGTSCQPTTANSDGNPWPLIRDFESATPMGDAGGFAYAVRDHFVALSP